MSTVVDIISTAAVVLALVFAFLATRRLRSDRVEEAGAEREAGPVDALRRTSPGRTWKRRSLSIWFGLAGSLAGMTGFWVTWEWEPGVTVLSIAGLLVTAWHSRSLSRRGLCQRTAYRWTIPPFAVLLAGGSFFYGLTAPQASLPLVVAAIVQSGAAASVAIAVLYFTHSRRLRIAGALGVIVCLLPLPGMLRPASREVDLAELAGIVLRQTEPVRWGLVRRILDEGLPDLPESRRSELQSLVRERLNGETSDPVATLQVALTTGTLPGDEVLTLLAKVRTWPWTDEDGARMSFYGLSNFAAAVRIQHAAGGLSEARRESFVRSCRALDVTCDRHWTLTKLADVVEVLHAIGATDVIEEIRPRVEHAVSRMWRARARSGGNRSTPGFCDLPWRDGCSPDGTYAALRLFRHWGLPTYVDPRSLAWAVEQTISREFAGPSLGRIYREMWPTDAPAHLALHLMTREDWISGSADDVRLLDWRHPLATWGCALLWLSILRRVPDIRPPPLRRRRSYLDRTDEDL